MIKYSYEAHGGGFAIYINRTPTEHGANIAQVYLEKDAQLIVDGLNLHQDLLDSVEANQSSFNTEIK